jgi:dUTP pyrophosphatase
MLTQTIKVKYLNKDLPKLQRIEKGEWIDLYSAKELTITRPTVSTVVKRKTQNQQEVFFASYMIYLNVCMELPKGFEAVVNPRSSIFKKYGVILANSQGIIDNSYCGDNDQWGFHALFLNEGLIKVGDRIAQFRIQPSQFASFWTKLKWLFTSKIRLIEVDTLGNANRNGFGSTGKQ